MSCHVFNSRALNLAALPPTTSVISSTCALVAKPMARARSEKLGLLSAPDVIRALIARNDEQRSELDGELQTAMS